MSATVDLSNGRYLPISGTTTYVISYGKRQTRGKASEAAFSSYLEVGCTDSPTGYLFGSISVSSLSLSLRSLLAGKESKGDKAKDRGRTPSLNVKGSSFSRDLKMDYTKRMDRMSEMVDSSHLIPDKENLGFRFPCDGPGRGGTCQVSAWDHVFLGLFWMYNSISLYCIRLVIRLPCPVRTVWSVTTQPERKPFLIGSFPGESCYALALIGKGLVHGDKRGRI
ncbi:hypothetical protein T459_30678 [Capsicum annuum]|uniref:photosystem I n=1 Tax=Capsicum annuum TaxID=4072 RepID=A0A2G2Y918_CAPAN|nr:hypothetical protein T459_30678 [Capsicum annuum]